MLRSLVLGCALALLAAGPAHAADFVVNAVDDHVADACDSECTLRDAVNAAELAPDADTITLPAGTIALSEGPLQITRPVLIQGSAQGTTIDPAYSSRILEISGGPVTVSRVTLSRAQSPDSLGGAALLQHSGTVTLDRVVVDAMSTNHAGGALLQQGGSLTITDSEVRASHGFSGGGLFVASGTTTVDRTLWLSNDGSTGGGGAIFNGGGTLTVTNSTFAGNSANSAHGGAIYAGAGSTTLRNVTFQANVASGINGGGSALWSDVAVTTSNVLFGVTGYQDSCAGPAALNEQGGSVDAAHSCAVALQDRPVRLGPLDANGGIARSFLPWADSAGPDQGDNAHCTALDQRSAPRAHDGTDPCDAGALEGIAAVAAPPPVVAGVKMTPGARVARFDATIDRQGLPTGYELEYGTTTAYGQTVPDTVPFGPGAGAQPVQLFLELDPATTYHYRVVATSAGGTVEGPDRTFTTLANDQIAITAAPPAFTASASAVFGFTASPGVGGLECVLTGPGQTGDPAFCQDTISYDLSDDGDYTFTVRSEDGAVSATRTFTLDRTPPPAPQVEQTGAGTFAFTSEPGATFECSLDNGAFAPCTSPARFDALPPGTHTITIRSTDPAGNRSTQSSRTFTIASIAQETPTPTPTPNPVPQKAATGVPSGTVKIKLPGGKFAPFDPSQPIPTGSEIDVTHGKITLTAKLTPGGKPQTATFYAGIFKLTLGKKTTDLTLSQPLAKCPKNGAAHAAAKKKPKTRKLWGNGSGSFRTRGQYSAATVRGTQWLVQDSCAGTLTRVVKGVVSVRDNVKHKTILLKAGKKYLARPRR